MTLNEDFARRSCVSLGKYLVCPTYMPDAGRTYVWRRLSDESRELVSDRARLILLSLLERFGYGSLFDADEIPPSTEEVLNEVKKSLGASFDREAVVESIARRTDCYIRNLRRKNLEYARKS